ncbi:Cyn operon transcriptional activator [Slackia heliotrinireducens]|uniref:Transcriptional regulator n=1 Tax=Slackia heliotrinireducens (strain ATCC 29202 / DSM 20476 / NCTC 11029 / RHS 1) TaxID=471855 RepID=C7N345_SLAHD|nr:LysR family transcriptional regulator [Slackia heliotrinireducens]ACV21566.1 transcriptional regulator [Slackia heliotrinireducens DSM 20476]VEG99071.1 Cyn operon transcriptional activator [Slackia heliotrinireducens]
MSMISNNVKVFVAVAEAKSVTVAAKRLYISQPAVSKAVKTLEDDLGTKLFRRSKRTGLALTTAGEDILKLAYALIRTENDMYQTAFRENNVIGGRVTVASLPITTTMWLAPALQRFKARYPQVAVAIREDGVEEIETMVKDQVADFGLVDYTDQELEHRTLLPEQFCGVVSSKSQVTSVSLVDDQDRLIMNDMSRDFLIPLLPPDAGHFETSLIVREPESVIRLAEHECGIGIVAPFVIAASGRDVSAIPITPAVYMDFGIVANSFESLSPAAAELVRFIEEVATEQLESGLIQRLG